jgi:glyoxylase-like metal-dependent hydrolase (beta-lactamase superfamily II)
MRTGSVEWALVSDGSFRLDGGAMFGVVPQPLWARQSVPDEQNRIRLGLHPLLVRSGGRTILVDCGIGRKEKGRFPEIFAVGDETDIVRSLAEHGVAAGDVDTLVYTHLHFDHAGGGTRLDADGRAVPVFPNARHVVQRAELDDAENATERSRASYLPENWKPIRAAGLLDVVDGETELAPGVRTFQMKGHVRSLTGIVIESGAEKVVYPSDNMPTSAHVPVPWVMAYDLYPLDTVAFKEEFLPQAIDEEWTVVFEHDPEVGAVKIGRDGKRFDLEEVLSAPARAASAPDPK